MEEKPTESAFIKNQKLVRKFSDPKTISDHLSSNTEGFAKHAPNITAGLNTAAMSGQQFLQSKLPMPQMDFPLTKDHKPSKASMAKFNQYFDVLNDPLSILHHVKKGTLRDEHLEAIQSVYPSLLGELRQKVGEQLAGEKAKSVNYKTKLSIAKFMSQPMDASMLPQAIAANQAALSGPRLSGNTQMPQQNRSSLGGLKMLNSSERAATKTQDDFDEKKD